MCFWYSELLLQRGVSSNTVDYAEVYVGQNSFKSKYIWSDIPNQNYCLTFKCYQKSDQMLLLIDHAFL